MEKLKVNFLQIQNVLLMKVVYQDDSISIGNLRWSSDQGYIYSSSLPAMDWPILYIRGTNKKKDNIWNTAVYQTTEEASYMLEQYKKLIKEFNES